MTADGTIKLLDFGIAKIISPADEPQNQTVTSLGMMTPAYASPEQIRGLGEELYNRLVTFTDAFARVGKSLDSSVTAFNKAVGSFDARVLPAARKFTELGITPKEELQNMACDELSLSIVHPLHNPRIPEERLSDGSL